MTIQEINQNIIRKKSFLCVGLDTDIQRIPEHLIKYEDPIFSFNKEIIDATHEFAIAFKPNTAFYESLGSSGWKSLEKTAEYIKSNYPDIFLIADAKRADIGNTSKMYAKTFFENMPFDAVTVAPYMGADSVKPFLEYDDKFVILLALTSNEGSNDFQFLTDCEGEYYHYERVLKTSSEWADENKMMYVAGATKADKLEEIRKIVPENFLLVPGVGAQGGSLEDVIKFGRNKNNGLIINSSRGIIYADNSVKFAEKAREKAVEIQQQMSKLF